MPARVVKGGKPLTREECSCFTDLALVFDAAAGRKARPNTAFSRDAGRMSNLLHHMGSESGGSWRLFERELPKFTPQTRGTLRESAEGVLNHPECPRTHRQVIEKLLKLLAGEAGD